MQKNLTQKNDNLPEVFDTKDIVVTLSDLMKKVTKEKCDPNTVNAACNCAGRITDLLRVHLEVEKLRKKAI